MAAAPPSHSGGFSDGTDRRAPRGASRGERRSTGWLAATGSRAIPTPPCNSDAQKAARAIRLPGRPRGRSLSVGEQLSAPVRLSLAAPLDSASGGRHPPAPSSSSVSDVPDSIPAVRAVRKEERSVKRLASPASASRHAAHHSPTPFQRRGCLTPLGPSRTSWSLHRMPPASDALVVTRRHARVGLLTARSAAREHLALRLRQPCG